MNTTTLTLTKEQVRERFIAIGCHWFRNVRQHTVYIDTATGSIYKQKGCDGLLGLYARTCDGFYALYTTKQIKAMADAPHVTLIN